MPPAAFNNCPPPPEDLSDGPKSPFPPAGGLCPDQRSTHPARNSCSVSQVRSRPPSAGSSLLSGKRSGAWAGLANGASAKDSRSRTFHRLGRAGGGRALRGKVRAGRSHLLALPAASRGWRGKERQRKARALELSGPARLSRDHLCCLAIPGAHLLLVARPFYSQPLPPFPPQISEAHSLSLREGGERDKYEKTTIILPDGIT